MVALGRCCGCGREGLQSEWYCQECLAALRQRARVRYRAHKAAGICVWCTEPAAPGLVRCQRHHEEMLQRCSGRHAGVG